MLKLERRSHRSSRERGQVVVLMALLIPVFFGLGAIVIDIGNWYVHKKNLQTLVDAGAFAAGTEFSACFQDPALTNPLIHQRALEYAGDTARDASTRNLQVQEPNDVRVVLNSGNYWAKNDPTDGSTHDYTLPAIDGAGNPVADALPCSVKFLDVKATDDEAPLLWGLLPLRPSPKARARVQIHDVPTLSGTLPWGVPEEDPEVVAALIVNEDLAPSDPNSVIRAVSLVRQTNLPPNDPLRSWSVWRADTLGLSLSGRLGVVILTSRDPAASVPPNGGSLSAICGQNPVRTHCFSGAQSTSGLSFIRAYSDSASPVAVRRVELTSLTCTNDLSAPYFLLNGGCTVQVNAVVDFGVTGDPQPFPTCGSVSSSPGGNMTWSAGGIGGALGTWTSTITLPDAPPSGSGGRTPVNLTANYRNPARSNCSNRLSVSEARVAAPYVASDASGPVEYLEVLNLDDGTLANAINQSPPGRNLRITVGLVPPLEVAQSWNEPPVYLRVTTNSSQTQAIDCDDGSITGPAGTHANFRNEIIDGCFTYYSINRRNGDCSGYTAGNLPPATAEPTPPNPYPDCVITQTGLSTGQIRQAVQTRFGGSPCKTLNNWPTSASDDYPDPSDPRLIKLFIVNTGSFSGSGQQIFPVEKFGTFYLTGGDGLGCPGDDPPPPGTRQASAWGHFFTIANVDPSLRPSNQLCDFTQVGVCLAVLVD